MGRVCCAECARHDAEADRPRAQASAAPEPAPAPRAGNQELLRLARSARASRPVLGAVDDPVEREADAMADQVMAGETVRRSPAGGGPGGGGSTAPGSVAAAVGSPGRALDPGTRGRMERIFGADLSRVRVHDDGPAASSAAEIGADAYTLGPDIAFARGRYAPGTAAGQRLLAHELGHVVQQAGGAATVRRQVPPAQQPVDADVCLVDVTKLTNEELFAQSRRVKTYLDARRRGEDDYYAYNNLGRRLDTERRDRMRRGHLYLSSPSFTLPTEVFRLKQNGMNLDVYRDDAAALHGMPGPVDGFLLTEPQFRQALDELHIPQISLHDYLAAQLDPRDPILHLLMPERPAPPPLVTWPSSPFAPTDVFGVPRFSPFGPAGFPMFGGGAGPGQVILLGGTAQADPALPWSPMTSGILGARPPSLFAMNARNALAQPINYDPTNVRSRAGALSNYRGDLAELSYGRGTVGGVLTQRDLNALQANFEVYDYRARGSGLLTSVTSTMPTPLGPPGNPPPAQARPLGPIDTSANWSQYNAKVAFAFGQEEPAKLTTATNRLNAEYGTTLTSPDVATTGYLAINEDHVSAFRARVRSALPANPSDYRMAIDAVLRVRPMEVRTTGGVILRIDGWNALQVARPQLAAADYDGALGRAADLVTARIVSNAITTEQLARLTTFREYTMGLGMTPEQYRAQVPPELVDSIRYGPLPAAGRAGLRGGAVQGVIGTGFDAYRMMTDPYSHPYAPLELATRGGVQVAGGFLSLSSEAAIIASVNESLLGQTGAFANLARGGARIGGGVGPAFVIAPAVTTATMGLDELFTDAYYTRIDYSAAAARSAVAGGGGALAAGAAGALIGTPEAPLVGTAIGFVVGFLGYLLVDALVGDDVERSVREGMGEGGCPRPPRPPPSPFADIPDPPIHCFAHGTRIRMADGALWPIEDIRRGDKVMAIDVRTGTSVAQVIENTAAHPDALVLNLLLADGTRLRTTPGHPIFDGTAWVEAGRLGLGEAVVRVSDDPAAPMIRVAVVATSIDPAEPVHDLTVSGLHTFVAEGVVVHNKIF